MIKCNFRIGFIFFRLAIVYGSGTNCGLSLRIVGPRRQPLLVKVFHLFIASIMCK